MNNKDYAYLLTQKRNKKTKLSIDDVLKPDKPGLTLNQARVLQHINEEIRQIAQQYEFAPNTNATRDALAISIGQSLEYYQQHGIVNDARIRNIQMDNDGTATVNITYQPSIAPITIDVEIDT